MIDLRNVRIQKLVDGQDLGDSHWYATCVQLRSPFEK